MSQAAVAPFTVSCTGCGGRVERRFEPTCAACGAMTEVEYDLAAVTLHESESPYMRYRELLPVVDAALLDAAARPTPAVHAWRLGEELGIPWLFLKDETGLPTGTTKDRMATVALAYLHECGVRAFCTSSTGNSSTAFAHRIVRFPGMKMVLFTAAEFVSRVDCPPGAALEHHVLEGATFVEAFAAARAFAARHGLMSEGGYFNLGRREGLKVAFLEAAEQVPRPIDWYVQAVSSAMGVHGAWKGARELQALGRLERLPRLLCVQQESCAPMVAAWESGSATVRREHVVEHPRGIATAILRGDPTRTYPHVREIVLASGGTFVAVDERAMRRAREQVQELAGLDPCFAAAAAVAAAAKLAARGDIDREDVVLVNLTGRERG